MRVFDHIRAEAANFSVQSMCSLLGVLRSGPDHRARVGLVTIAPSSLQPSASHGDSRRAFVLGAR